MYNKNQYFKHFKQVDQSKWQFKNFTPQELASKGDGSLLLNVEAVSKLQELRDLINKPLKINSAYRDPLHNKTVGGSPNSYHLQGKAFDISIRGLDRLELRDFAEDVDFTGFGYYNTFLHVDTRKNLASWGTWT